MLTHLAITAWALLLSVVVLALVSSVLVRAGLDLGARSLVHRRWLSQWLARVSPGSAGLDDLLGQLAQHGVEASILALDYRQICAQISAVLQAEISTGKATPLVQTLGPTTSPTRDQSTGASPSKGTDEVSADLQHTSDSTERRIDSLQAYLAHSTTLLTYDAASAISLLLIPLLLVVSNLEPSALDASKLPADGAPGTPTPLLLLPFLIVYAALLANDLDVDLRASLGWLRGIIPIAAIIVILVAQLAPDLPDLQAIVFISAVAFAVVSTTPRRLLRVATAGVLVALVLFAPVVVGVSVLSTMAVFILAAIVAGFMSPIFSSLLNQLYAPR